jgi:formiminotetrahydrofolate cyclodeaminase
VQNETIDGYLQRLADRVPAPGGGAAAALHAAQAAALLGMVARYSDRTEALAAQVVVAEVLRESDELRGIALRLAEEDAQAFSAVAGAYRLPKGTEEQRSARSAAIAAALVEAAVPPAETVQVAGRLVELAERLLPVGNRNVITDVAAAAEAARAAATTGRVNVEVNLGGIKDLLQRERLRASIDGVDETVLRADRVTAQVRARIAG